MSMPTVLNYGESVQDFISVRVGGQTGEFLNGMVEDLNSPDIQQQLLNANKEKSEAVKKSLRDINRERKEQKTRITAEEFERNGQAIRDKLEELSNLRRREEERREERAKDRRAREQRNINTPDVIITQSRERVEAEARVNQRLNIQRQEGENISIIADILIEQGIYDAMPEFNNPDTSTDQQYDPRYGEAYANNFERMVNQALRVRPAPTYNADSIGDTSALVLAGAFIVRGIIGKLYKKGKKNITKKNRKNKLERNPQEVRQEIRIEHNINLPEPEYLELPEITETPGNIYSIPIPDGSQYVYSYFSEPFWGEFYSTCKRCLFFK